MSYTIYGRLRQVLSSKSGRRHLFSTWRFALNQFWRASSGKQLDEILNELNKIKVTPSLRLPEDAGKFRSQFSDFAHLLGAGKQNGHEYVYQFLDFDTRNQLNILEIGIGTNNPKLPSSMGADGRPGSSLHLWTRMFPNSKVAGADVDRAILLNEDNIFSFYLDSTNQKSIDLFVSEITNDFPSGFDLIVDDGLHTPESNLRLLNALLPLVRPGGFYVIEDIPEIWAGFWEKICASFPGILWRIIGSTEKTKIGMHSFAILKKPETQISDASAPTSKKLARHKSML